MPAPPDGSAARMLATDKQQEEVEHAMNNRETALLYVRRISQLLDEIAKLDLGDEEAAKALDGLYPTLRWARARLEASSTD
jgi:hypothetical protein